MRFQNRADAGRQLAAVLRTRSYVDPIVVGLTRGGVPVAAEIARLLNLPLEVEIVRKVVVAKAPHAPVGAVAEGGGGVYLDDARIFRLELTVDDVASAVAKETLEVARLAGLYRDRRPTSVRGRDVILVDDNVATGDTMRAAVRSLRRAGARSIEVAVPIGTADVVSAIATEADRVTCLVREPMIIAVGARYDSFETVTDAEVIELQAQARGRDRAVAIATP